MGKYVKVASARDRHSFFGFKNCGHLNHEQLKNLGMSDTRIKSYCRDGIFKKVAYDIKGQVNNGICYKLSDEGKKYATTNWGFKKFAQNTNGHERHNLDVANKYMSLTQEERATVLNEREVRDLVQDRIWDIENKQERDQAQELLDQGTMSMPDIVYTTEEGVTMAFETITNNYGEVDIVAKQETCTFIKAELELHKI